MSLMTANCPVCDGGVPVGGDAVISEMIVCGSCCVALEVRSLDPVRLEEAPQEEEDWGQ